MKKPKQAVNPISEYEYISRNCSPLGMKKVEQILLRMLGDGHSGSQQVREVFYQSRSGIQARLNMLRYIKDEKVLRELLTAAMVLGENRNPAYYEENCYSLEFELHQTARITEGKKPYLDPGTPSMYVMSFFDNRSAPDRLVVELLHTYPHELVSLFIRKDNAITVSDTIFDGILGIEFSLADMVDMVYSDKFSVEQKITLLLQCYHQPALLKSYWRELSIPEDVLAGMEDRLLKDAERMGLDTGLPLSWLVEMVATDYTPGYRYLLDLTS